MEKWKTCHVAIMYIARMNCHVLSVLLGGRASSVKQIVRQRGAIEVPACPTDMTSAFQRTWKEIAWKNRHRVPLETTMQRLYAFHVWF